MRSNGVASTGGSSSGGIAGGSRVRSRQVSGEVARRSVIAETPSTIVVERPDHDAAVGGVVLEQVGVLAVGDDLAVLEEYDAVGVVQPQR